MQKYLYKKEKCKGPIKCSPSFSDVQNYKKSIFPGSFEISCLLYPFHLQLIFFFLSKNVINAKIFVQKGKM